MSDLSLPPSSPSMNGALEVPTQPLHPVQHSNELPLFRGDSTLHACPPAQHPLAESEATIGFDTDVNNELLSASGDYGTGGHATQGASYSTSFCVIRQTPQKPIDRESLEPLPYTAWWPCVFWNNTQCIDQQQLCNATDGSTWKRWDIMEGIQAVLGVHKNLGGVSTPSDTTTTTNRGKYYRKLCGIWDTIILARDGKIPLYLDPDLAADVVKTPFWRVALDGFEVSNLVSIKGVFYKIYVDQKPTLHELSAALDDFGIAEIFVIGWVEYGPSEYLVFADDKNIIYFFNDARVHKSNCIGLPCDIIQLTELQPDEGDDC